MILPPMQLENRPLDLTATDIEVLLPLVREALARLDDNGWIARTKATPVTDAIHRIAVAHGLDGFTAVGWSTEADGTGLKVWVLYPKRTRR